MSNIKVGQFPSTRLRRLRMKDFSRRMISENNLSVNDLIWPIFVCEGNNIADKINSMPGVFRYSIDSILKELETVINLKIPAVALFPQIENSLKDENGSQAVDENNLICRTIKAIKKKFPEAISALAEATFKTMYGKSAKYIDINNVSLVANTINNLLLSNTIKVC